MTRKCLLVFAVLALAGLMCGCAGVRMVNAPVVPPVGWLYSDYSAPMEVNYQGSDLGTRKGSAKTQYILIPFPIAFDIAWGDAAIQEAAEDGGITTVKGADYEFMQVIGLYAECTVHVYGD